MTLIVIAASVRTEGINRVKPSVYLSPMAQQISISPAKNRMTHAMKRSFNGQGRPRKK
jgi:hypothetical protein